LDPGFDARFSDGERSDDDELDEGSDTDEGFVPHTHDVIISEIEEINLADYMRTLEPPVFDEEAALADAFFGFGAGAFLRGKEKDVDSVQNGTAELMNGVSSRSANTNEFAFADEVSSRNSQDAVSAVSSPANDNDASSSPAERTDTE
jgi:hypothetical protein